MFTKNEIFDLAIIINSLRTVVPDMADSLQMAGEGGGDGGWGMMNNDFIIYDRNYLSVFFLIVCVT